MYTMFRIETTTNREHTEVLKKNYSTSMGSA